MENKGILYIVATPIGNWQDITKRAIEILKTVDIIACENIESNKRRLISMCSSIKGHFISYYDGNEHIQSLKLTEKLRLGQSIALVSSAGTPLLCDPGYKLVQEAIKNNIQIIPIPGACSFVSALVCAGVSTFPFTFFGFFPKNHGERLKIIDNLPNNNYTSIYFESSHRIVEVSAIIMAKIEENTGRNCKIYESLKIVLIKDITKATFDRLELNRETLETLKDNNNKKYLGEWILIFDKYKK
jgi:16S rRNA (cytidine1402-2'-O)-methyltransferase